MDIVKIPIDELTPDPNNAKDHPQWQIEQIKNSIEQFGNLDPIGVWGDNNLIVEGHGRYEALKELGYNEAECIRLDWLTEEERTAYALAHNKLTMNSGFIPEQLDINLDAIGEIDMSLFGFRSDDWFSNRERNDNSRQEGNDEYNEFLDKFETKKTTDDCYTPQNIYDVIAEWVAKEYKLDSKKFFRPFYPGGNYQNENYEGKIVVDNPPFSILSEIEQWYNEHGVKYFLFAPNVTTFASKRKCCSVCVGVGITYENGACVMTSFVTNLEDDLAARTAPDLYKLVDAANKENTKGKEFPVYEYPPNVVTAAMLSYLSKYGQDLRLAQKDVSEKINGLDEQKKVDKGIFGGGFLISEKAAAEKAAAEKAAAEKAAATVWKLSDRELEIIKSLGGDSNDAS